MLFSRLPLLAVAASSAVRALEYEIPEELANLGQESGTISSNAVANCSYPAQYGVYNVMTFVPFDNATTDGENVSTDDKPFLEFSYFNKNTDIMARCIYNATSVSLTAGKDGLADRYACVTNLDADGTITANDITPLAFIWEKYRLTLIEAICPGLSATHYEASGSITFNPSNMSCGTEGTFFGVAGTSCFPSGLYTVNFTSQQPSPLQTTTSAKARLFRA